MSDTKVSPLSKSRDRHETKFPVVDQISIQGAGTKRDPWRAVALVPSQDPNAQLAGGEDGAPGQVIRAEDPKALLAQANTLANAGAIGFLGAGGMVLASEAVEWVSIGILILGTILWDAQTGDSGGLSPGMTYYLSQTAAGHITKTRPVSGLVIPVGVALTSTAMQAQIGSSSTAGAAAPSTEHVTTGVAGGFPRNNAVADPNINLTIITEGADADGRQDISLANGSVDGFEKTIMWPQGAVPVIGYRVTPASGPVVNFGDTPGAVTYRWDEDTLAWLVQSTRNSV